MSVIKSFGLRNFKAFHYLENIDIAPLTVLVGANSAGKSSILQSLLLLKQSSKSSSSEMLKFNDLVTLENYGSVVSDFDTSNILEYRFEIEFDLPPKHLKDFFPDTPFTPEENNQRTWCKSSITIQFCFDEIDQNVDLNTFEVVVTPLMSGEQNSKSPLKCLAGEISEDDLSIKFSIRDGGNVVVHHNLPQVPYLVKWDDLNISRFGLVHFWPRQIIINKKVGIEDNSDDVMTLPIASIFSVGLPLIALERTLIEELEYLGGVRADPRPFYPVGDNGDIGARGENTVPYLLRHKSDEIEYRPSVNAESQKSDLLGAVNHWLKRMGVTEELTIDPVESIAYVAKVKSPSSRNKKVNLNQVGFGVSQLLPVLVMGLKQPQDSFILLEQPEIHLHPRLQGELAEFLLCAAQSGKTIMVETHSDHLVNRLRRLIAEDETGELSKMVNILFVHSGTEEDPGSYVEQLAIDELGNITNWPPDFLSDASNDARAILKAAARKAKGKK